MRSNVKKYSHRLHEYSYLCLVLIKTVILGTGNVGSHLLRVIPETSGVEIVQVYNRSASVLREWESSIPVTDSLHEIKPADLYIIAVNDRSIEEVSAALPKDVFAVHTSGSTPMSALTTRRKGVFYPLQTFTKNRKVDFSGIPICIEASHAPDRDLLRQLASRISRDVREIDSDQRIRLHIAAVFANNFTNYLWGIAQEICEQNGMDFDILYPLIDESVRKIKDIPPVEAQTGPARRGDRISVEKHWALLDEEKKKIYKLLSEAIAHKYGKKL